MNCSRRASKLARKAWRGVDVDFKMNA